MPILEAAGVQMVFAGHNHFYERTQPIHDIVHIVTGGGGAKLHVIKTRAAYSAVIVEKICTFTMVDIAGDRLKLTQIDERGRTVDTFELSLRAP